VAMILPLTRKAVQKESCAGVPRVISSIGSSSCGVVYHRMTRSPMGATP
jgi:hypothetical protein